MPSHLSTDRCGEGFFAAFSGVVSGARARTCDPCPGLGQRGEPTFPQVPAALGNPARVHTLSPCESSGSKRFRSIRTAGVGAGGMLQEGHLLYGHQCCAGPELAVSQGHPIPRRWYLRL